MKQIRHFLVLVAALLMATVSCQQAPFLTMTGPRTFNFTRDGGTQSFTFSCNRDWSISTSESWVSVSPSSGTTADGDIKITITCSANSTYDGRSATITVRTEELSETVTVTQDTGIGLIVSPTTFDLTNAAQDIEIEVQKNIQYSIAIDEAGLSWIKAGGTKALTTDKITFHIAENEDYDGREGKITFKQTDGPLTATVVVRQSQKNGLFITTSTYDLSNEAHTLAVEVKANVEFEVTTQADWIKYVETKGLKASTVTLTIDANESYDNRTGTVLVKQTNGDLEGTIVINQKQTDGLFVTPDSFEVSNQEQTVELTVKENVAYSVVIPDDAKTWVAVQGTDNTKALVEEKVVLAIAKNTTYDDRETSVTIKQNNGPLAETVKIKQAYGEGLIVESKIYEIEQAGGTIEVTVKANVEYEVTPQAQWVHYVETKALSNSTVTLSIDKNETLEKRTASVLFKQKNGELTAYIKITQAERIPVSSLVLSKKATALIVGQSETLTAWVGPYDATDDKTVYWSSSDDKIATIADGKITAIAEGGAEITAIAGDVTAKCSVLVQVVPEGAVNLGTLSQYEDGSPYYVFWATKNLGATSKEDDGNYYAWGETETKENYSWENYKWCNGGEYKLNKYSALGWPSYYWDGPGEPDGKYRLEPEDDAAHVMLGEKWRIPTYDDFVALKDQCTWTWKGSGYEIKSKVNSNSIFLPITGYYAGSNKTSSEPTYFWYWTNGVAGPPSKGSSLVFNSVYIEIVSQPRYYGIPIRPVSE